MLMSIRDSGLDRSPQTGPSVGQFLVVKILLVVTALHPFVLGLPSLLIMLRALPWALLIFQVPLQAGCGGSGGVEGISGDWYEMQIFKQRPPLTPMPDCSLSPPL